MTANFLVKFISAYLNVPAVIVKDNSDFYSSFEKAHCFSLKLQQEFTAEAMELFCQSIDKPFLYELRSVFAVDALIFPFNSEIIIVGPYVEEGWEDKNGTVVLAQNHLPVTQLVQYKLYYSNYPIIKRTELIRSCSVAISAADSQVSSYNIRIISSLKSSSAVDKLQEVIDFQEAEQRYAIENEFLRCVKKGDVDKALETFESIRTRYSNVGIYTKRDLTHCYVAAASMRTLLRKAVEEAGVSSSTIDSLSSMYAQKSFALKNLSEMNTLYIEMIQGYTEAVRQSITEDYSKPIKKAAAYIKLKLSSPLTLEEIAGVANLTPNYLSHAFKSETGMSVTQYIAKKRCEIAADLLSTTDLSVSDISTHVGYLDNNYFVKVFKSYYKLTPTTYRKQHH